MEPYITAMYVSKKERERGFTSIKDSLDPLIQLEDDKKRGRRLITVTRNNTYSASIK